MLNFKKLFSQKIVYFFNINNYNKPLQRQNIIRNHDKLIYDEFKNLQFDEQSQNEIIEQEKKTFKIVQDKVKNVYDQYMNVVKNRTVDIHDVPEYFGQYLYQTKYKFKDSIEREVIYRVEQNQDVKVLDVLDIPWVRKNHQKTVKLSGISFSDDHDKIAFIIDLYNNEDYAVGIKDIQNRTFSRVKISECSQIKFGIDSNILYFTKYNDKKRPYQIYRRDLRNQNDNDLLIFEEKDESFYVDLTQSKDGKYFIIISSNNDCSEIYIKDRLDDDSKLIKVLSKQKKQKALCNHSRDSFYFLIKEENTYDYVIQKLKDDNLTKFELVYKPQEDYVITDFDIFENNMVLYMNKNGVSELQTIDLNHHQVQKVDFKNDIHIITPGLNGNYKSNKFRFYVDNALIYNQIYEYDMEQKKVKTLNEFKMNGKKFDPNIFVQKRVDVPAEDGSLIPMTIIHKKNMKMDRQNKCLIHGYGAYGIDLVADFNIVYLSALENDWIIAYAHVRGGKEKGQNWYKNGKAQHKLNSFKDFINCSEYLIAEKYTHPSLLCAYGSSAGGLLVGQCLNLKPNLYKAAILNVPFLDPLTALLDESLALTESDHIEFGNPIKDKHSFDLIRGYSPYENIQNQEYPFVILQCGENDFRSPIWMALKYIKRFRDRVQNPVKIKEICNKNILLNTQEAGHHGQVGQMNQFHDKCLNMALLETILMDYNKEISHKQIWKI